MGEATAKTMSLYVEFTGGLELLFSNQREHTIDLPQRDAKGNSPTMGELIEHLCREVMKDSRQDMFVVDGNIRPGVLVLINDADWELEGEADYKLQPGDRLLFVSTLHGG